MSQPITRVGAVFVSTMAIACTFSPALGGEQVGSPEVIILGLDSPDGPGGILPYAVSNDGNTIALRGDFAGLGPRFPGYWTPASGVQPMRIEGPAEMAGAHISADGSTIVGTVNGLGSSRAFRWRGSGTFETFTVPSGGHLSSASGVTANGDRFIGTSIFNGELQGYIATPGDQFVALSPTRANGISADGGVVAGVEFLPEGSRAWYWTPQTGRQFIAGLGVEANASANGVSADGSTFFGGWNLLPSRGVEFERSGFAWSFETGLRNLSNFGPSLLQPNLVASNADGSVIVGRAWGGSGGTAAVWVEGSPLPREGREYIESLGYSFPDKLVGLSITDISDDGLTFVGTGFLDGENVGWIARIPSPPSVALFVLLGAVVARKR